MLEALRVLLTRPSFCVHLHVLRRIRQTDDVKHVSYAAHVWGSRLGLGVEF